MTLPFVDQPNPVLSWLLAGCAVVVTGIAKSGFGGGVGIVAVPLFILAVGSPKVALGAMLPLMIGADVFSVAHHWGKWDGKNLRQMLPGSLVGIALGAALIAVLGTTDGRERSLKMAIGAICVLYPAGEWMKARVAPRWKLEPSYAAGSAAGATAGLVSTLAHAAGPVAAMYLLAQQMAKAAFIGTTVMYFFVINTVKLVPYGLLGLIDTETLWLGLWLVPLIPLGTWLGANLNRVMSERLFRGVILLIVLLTGLQLLGVLSMLGV